jgi:hypothetical protein
MHSVIGDLICFDKNTKEIDYYNDVSTDFFVYDKIIKNKKDKIFITLTLEYSKNKIVDITKLNLKHSYQGFENQAKLIHPIIRVYEYIDNEFLLEEQHLDEDIIAEFTDKTIYYDKFLRILRMFIY